MELLVIGKPAVNYYLPLQEFPQEGDIFRIKERPKSIGNDAAIAACLLASWKMNVHFAGIAGNDADAEYIKNEFTTLKINQKFLEVSFTNPTSTNTIILNTKTGATTKIMSDDETMNSTRFKYDFVPDFVVMDATDSSSVTALLNNNQTVRTIMYASRPNHETIANAKRCTYVVCSQTYAETITKLKLEDNQEAYYEFFQKLINVCGSSNHIVILNNHKILYCVDNKAKMSPQLSITTFDNSSFDSVFFGAISFCLANGVSLDDSVKLANNAAALSTMKVGGSTSIPTIDEVLDNSGMRSKLGLDGRESSVKVGTNEINTPPVQAMTPESITPPTFDAFTGVAPTAGQNGMPPVMSSNVPVPPTAPAQQPQNPESNMFNNPNNV